MTLTARREPTFDGAGKDSHAALSSEAILHGGAGSGLGHGMAHAAPKPTGILRFVSTVQIVGSLLAVPVGLASAYSIYRANFSPETTCQQLRGNIIGMLDKNVDAATRRMLVRRDVESFEQNCGGVDPDAHAAFKRILAADLPATTKMQVAVPLPKAEPKPEVRVVKIEPKVKAKPELKVEKVEAKVEAKPEVKPERKLEAKAEPKAEPQTEHKAEAKAEPVQREAALSDTRWVAAVRQALVKHPVAVEPDEPVLHQSWTLKTPETVQPVALTPVLAPALAPVRAPELPPAQTITPQINTTPVQAADHPVPPGSIPEVRAVPLTQEPVKEPVQQPASDRSRLSEIISDIPVVGRMVRRGE